MTQNENNTKMWTFLMLQFPPIHSHVKLGEHMNNCLHGFKHAHKTPKMIIMLLEMYISNIEDIPNNP